MQLTIYQRTSSFLTFVIRCVGVIGGVWVCMGWAVKIGYRAAEAVTGGSVDEDDEVIAESSAISKKRWVGGELRSRPGAGHSPYSSYASTPVPTSGGFPMSPGYGAPAQTPGYAASRVPLPPSAGYNSPGFAQSPGYAPPPSAGFRNQYPPSPLPGQGGFPSSPGPAQGGFPHSPVPGAGGFPRSPVPGGGSAFASQQQQQYAVRASSGLRVSSIGEEQSPPIADKKEKAD